MQFSNTERSSLKKLDPSRHIVSSCPRKSNGIRGHNKMQMHISQELSHLFTICWNSLFLCHPVEHAGNKITGTTWQYNAMQLHFSSLECYLCVTYRGVGSVCGVVILHVTIWYFCDFAHILLSLLFGLLCNRALTLFSARSIMHFIRELFWNDVVFLCSSNPRFMHEQRSRTLLLLLHLW